MVLGRKSQEIKENLGELPIRCPLEDRTAVARDIWHDEFQMSGGLGRGIGGHHIARFYPTGQPIVGFGVQRRNPLPQFRPSRPSGRDDRAPCAGFLSQPSCFQS